MRKTVLITGSTSGIGFAFSEKFAKEGYNLILVSRDILKLEKQKNQLKKYDVSIEVIAKDLTTENVADEIAGILAEKQLSVDILVNNAGFNESGYFHETDVIQERGMINVHIITLTELTKLMLPQMLQKGSGIILNVGSTGSYIPSPLDAVYSATKAYVLSFTKALRGELKGTGVTATTLCPGATKTEFAKKADIENTMLFKLFVMPPEKVVNYTFKKMLKGKSVVVPGVYNKLLVLSSKFIPEGIINHITMRMMAKNKQ